MRKELAGIINELNVSGVTSSGLETSSDSLKDDLIELKISLLNCDYEKWNQITEKWNQAGLEYNIKVNGEEDKMTLSVGNETISMDFERRSFLDKDFSKFNLSNTSFKSMIFDQCQVNGINNSNVSFSQCEFDNVLFTSENLSGGTGKIIFSECEVDPNGKVAYQDGIELKGDIKSNFEAYQENAHIYMKDYGCDDSPEERKKDAKKSLRERNTPNSLEDIFSPRKGLYTDPLLASIDIRDYYPLGINQLSSDGHMPIALDYNKLLLFGFTGDYRNYADPADQLSLSKETASLDLGYVQDNFRFTAGYIIKPKIDYGFTDNAAESWFSRLDIPSDYKLNSDRRVSETSLANLAMPSLNTTPSNGGLRLKGQVYYNNYFSMSAEAKFYGRPEYNEVGGELRLENLQNGDEIQQPTQVTIDKPHSNEFNLSARLEIPFAKVSKTTTINHMGFDFSIFVEGGLTSRGGYSGTLELGDGPADIEPMDIEVPRLLEPQIRVGIKSGLHR